MTLSQENIKSWEESGVVILRQALSADEVNHYKNIVNNFYSEFLSGLRNNYSIDNETATVVPELWKKQLKLPREKQAFKRWNIISDHHDFVSLVDSEPAFNIISELMGPNIQVFRSQMIVVPGGMEEKPFLHTDSGHLGLFRSAPSCPSLMVSVQYFLSDLPESGMGNFAYVPGSQNKEFPYDSLNPKSIQTNGYAQGRNIQGRVYLQVKAGDAIIFPHSLWHGTSENISPINRMSLIYGYAQLFIRPYDYINPTEKTLEFCKTERQHRLIGNFGGWSWRPGCFHHPAHDQEKVVR